jgi:quinoprotein glucose dehydrogenase
MISRSLPVLVPLVLLAGLELAGQPAGMPSTRNGDWTHYTADVRGTKYSPLDQITSANFNHRSCGLRYPARVEFKQKGRRRDQDPLYPAGTRRSVVALDGKTGELIWTHSYREGNRAAIAPRCRRRGGRTGHGKGDDRVLYVTTGYWLIAQREERLDGHLVRRGGVVDLKKGAVTGRGSRSAGDREIGSTPPTVVATSC